MRKDLIMNKMKIIKQTGLLVIFGGAICCSCQKDLLEYENGDIKIRIEAGNEWIHPHDLFLGLKLQNPPQIAIWVEDMDGNYLATLYVSHKAGTNSWKMNHGDMRKEALPLWNHTRLPASDTDSNTGATTPKPVPDAVTGATHKGSFDIKMRPDIKLTNFVIKAEFNNDTDWNEHYPKAAKKGDENYTAESGQPAIVYRAEIDLSSGRREFTAQIVGHSSPDGSTGDLYTDLSKLTTAKNIVKEITIKIED